MSKRLSSDNEEDSEFGDDEDLTSEDLDLEPDTIFDQQYLISYIQEEAEKGGIELPINEKGICVGLCVDWFRHYAKRLHNGSLKDGNEFLSKSALAPIVYDEVVEGYGRDDLLRFVRRVSFYQAFLGTMDSYEFKKIDDKRLLIEGKVFDNDERFIRFDIKGSEGIHSIAVLKVSDKEYKLFDPNTGEYSKISSLDELNTILRFVISSQEGVYDSYEAIPYSKMLEQVVVGANKYVFTFIDGMIKPKDILKMSRAKIINWVDNSFREIPESVLFHLDRILPQSEENFGKIVDAILHSESIIVLPEAIPAMMKVASSLENPDLESRCNEIIGSLEQDGIFRLFKACLIRGDIDIIRSQIDLVPQVINVQDKNGDSLLHLGIWHNNKNALELILDHVQGESLELRNLEGERPVDIAIRLGHYDIAGLLIEKMTLEQLLQPNDHGRILSKLLQSKIANGLDEDRANIIKLKDIIDRKSLELRENIHSERISDSDASGFSGGSPRRSSANSDSSSEDGFSERVKRRRKSDSKNHDRDYL